VSTHPCDHFSYCVETAASSCTPFRYLQQVPAQIVAQLSPGADVAQLSPGADVARSIPAQMWRKRRARCAELVLHHSLHTPPRAGAEPEPEHPTLCGRYPEYPTLCGTLSTLPCAYTEYPTLCGTRSTLPCAVPGVPYPVR
jgi:hypothetical protein